MNYEPIKVKNLTLGDEKVKIIYPISGVTKEAIIDEMKYVKKTAADIVEWRVDAYEDAHDADATITLLRDVREALGDEKVLLFTVRTAGEGSVKEFDRDYYFELLNRAIDTNCIDMVDIEYYSKRDMYNYTVSHAKAKNVKTIGSIHVYDGTPETVLISDTIDMMQGTCDIPKMAVMTSVPQDCQRIFDAGKMLLEYEGAKYPSPFILIGMGDAGTETRKPDKFWGSCASFCAGRVASAPGQLSLDEMLELRDSAK